MSNTPTLNETLKLLTKGGPHHPGLVDAIYGVYALVDSLQHQLIQKDREMSHVSERLKFIDDGMDKTVAGFDRVVAQRDDLKKQLAERDRKITWLTNELGE